MSGSKTLYSQEWFGAFLFVASLLFKSVFFFGFFLVFFWLVGWVFFIFFSFLVGRRGYLYLIKFWIEAKLGNYCYCKGFVCVGGGVINVLYISFFYGNVLTGFHGKSQVQQGHVMNPFTNFAHILVIFLPFRFLLVQQGSSSSFLQFLLLWAFSLFKPLQHRNLSFFTSSRQEAYLSFLKNRSR